MTEHQDNVINFCKFREKARAAARSRTYKAWLPPAPQSEAVFIEFYYDNGGINLVCKRMIQEYRFISDQQLSVFFPYCVIVIEGRNLDPLFKLLKDEKILSLHCFDPKIHDQSLEEESIITSMERINLY